VASSTLTPVGYSPLPGTYHPARVLIKPDGFLRLQEQATDGDRFEHFFFLEVDRSTEPRETLARRVYGYQDFYRHGGLAVRHGFTPENYKDFPFRVWCFRTKNGATTWRNDCYRMTHRPCPWCGLPHSPKSLPTPSVQSGCGRLTTERSRQALNTIRTGRALEPTGGTPHGRGWSRRSCEDCD